MLSEDESEASPKKVKLNSITQVKEKPETPTQTGLKQKSTTQIIGQKSLVMEEEEQEEVVNNFKIKKTLQNEEDEAELPPVIQVSEYELQVQKNIAARTKLLESFGLFTAKEELLEVSRSVKVAKKSLCRGIAREPKSPVRPMEIRKSLRQQNIMKIRRSLRQQNITSDSLLLRRSLRQQNITPDDVQLTLPLFRKSLRQQNVTPDGVQLTPPSEKAVAQAEASFCSRPSRPPPAENVDSTETDGTQRCDSCSSEESNTPQVVKGKRKWKLDDIEKIIIDNLQTPEDRHLSFFKGILPTLQQLSEEQTLQFQMGVLNLLQNIRNAQSFVQPSPSYSQPMQYNAFYPTHANKFYPTPASSSTNLVGTSFQHKNNPSPNTVDNFISLITL